MTQTTVTPLQKRVILVTYIFSGLPLQQQHQQQFIVDRTHSPGYLINQPIDCQGYLRA